LSRDRLLGQARADLVALPDLVGELARLVADRTNHDVSGYHRKVVGSPAPLSIPVVHLVDQRHKPGWEGADPRIAPIGDRYGIVPTLTLWIRVLTEELPDYPELTEQATVRSECAVLLEHWSFIQGRPWAIRLADDVTRITGTVKAQLGIRPEMVLRCPQCSNAAYLQPGGVLACTEVPEHDLVVRDLDRQMRRRPPLPTKDICAEFDIEPGTLRVWKNRRKIKPAPSHPERDHWFPWDVFCLLNPDVAEAFAARDDTSSEPAEQAV
jgi:hypothetical protein